MIAWPVLILYIYGILLILGGLIGYVKAKSVPSAVAGCVCGFLALLIGYNYTWHYAPYAALLLSLVLLVMMGRRFFNSRKVMPAGLIVILSLIVAVVQVYVLIVLGKGND